MELLDTAQLDEDGNRMYMLDGDPGEMYTEDAAGEEFVFLVSTRYFGTTLDCADDDLFETVMQGYAYKKISATGMKTDHKPTPANGQPKPWWKFW